MKTSSSILRAVLLTGVLVGLGTLHSSAQSTGSTTQVTPSSTTTTPAKAIGPAPANSPQKQILSSSLSPETRQTLQQAMNSYNPAPATTNKSATTGK